MATEEKIIKDAQYRKGLSIAFFNATNNATQIVELIHKSDERFQIDTIKTEISYWRDWLLKEHENYYRDVISSIGKPYDSKKTIENLKKATSAEELKKMFMMMSADEKRDGDIRKVVAELKKTLK